MPESEWVARAVNQLGAFVEMHQDDATRLVLDLRRSWPALGPEDAVSCFFQPLLRQSGATEIRWCAVEIKVRAVALATDPQLVSHRVKGHQGSAGVESEQLLPVDQSDQENADTGQLMGGGANLQSRPRAATDGRPVWSR